MLCTITTHTVLPTYMYCNSKTLRNINKVAALSSLLLIIHVMLANQLGNMCGRKITIFFANYSNYCLIDSQFDETKQ